MQEIILLNDHYSKFSKGHKNVLELLDQKGKRIVFAYFEIVYLRTRFTSNETISRMIMEF